MTRYLLKSNILKEQNCDDIGDSQSSKFNFIRATTCVYDGFEKVLSFHSETCVRTFIILVKFLSHWEIVHNICFETTAYMLMTIAAESSSIVTTSTVTTISNLSTSTAAGTTPPTSVTPTKRSYTFILNFV